MGGGGNSPKTANSSLKDGWWQTSSKDKEGGFIGGELGFGNGWIGENSGLVLGGDSIFVPHINMIGGYQWYFLDRPWLHLGLRLKGYLGYSNYSTDNSYDFSNISSHAIHTGIEVGAIYDFVQYKEHTLGVYVAPIGFELSVLFGNVTINEVNGDIIDKTFSLTPYVTFTYKYSMGLHYYYNVNHIVFLGYQLNWSYGGSKDKYNGNRSLDNLKSMGFQADHFHSFMIGYAYKF